MTNSPENFPSNRSLEQQIPGGLWSSEIKLLGATLFWVNPTAAYALSSIMDKMTERQGEYPGWVATPLDAVYLRKNLVQSGTIVGGRGQDETDRRVSVYHANTDDPTTKLAYAGGFFSWSLDNPKVSLQRLYGSALAGDTLNTPKKRHQVYSALVAHTADTSPRIIELADAVRPEGWSVKRQLELMADWGILDITSTVSQDVSVTIKSDRYTGKRPLEMCKPETQAAYMAIQRLGKGAVTTIHAIVAESLKINPTIDPIVLRRNLIRGATNKDPAYPGLKPIQPREQQSSVRIKPGLEEPIKDLYDRLATVEAGGKAALDKYTGIAERIVKHDSAGARSDFKSLVIKGRANSSSSRDYEQLDHRLAEVMVSIGAASVKEAATALLDRYPDTGLVSASIVRSAFARLEKSGIIEVETMPKPNSKRSVTIFRPRQA